MLPFVDEIYSSCGWDLAEYGWDLVEFGWDLAKCGWDLAELWMRSSRVWMRSSRVVRAFDSQRRSRNCRGFDPSILRHSGIWGRQIKQRWISYIQYKEKIKKIPFKKVNVDIVGTGGKNNVVSSSVKGMCITIGKVYYCNIVRKRYLISWTCSGENFRE